MSMKTKKGNPLNEKEEEFVRWAQNSFRLAELSFRQGHLSETCFNARTTALKAMFDEAEASADLRALVDEIIKSAYDGALEVALHNPVAKA